MSTKPIYGKIDSKVRKAFKNLADSRRGILQEKTLEDVIALGVFAMSAGVTSTTELGVVLKKRK